MFGIGHLSFTVISLSFRLSIQSLILPSFFLIGTIGEHTGDLLGIMTSNFNIFSISLLIIFSISGEYTCVRQMNGFALSFNSIVCSISAVLQKKSFVVTRKVPMTLSSACFSRANNFISHSYCNIAQCSSFSFALIVIPASFQKSVPKIKS